MLSRSGSSGFHRDPYRDAHALAVVRVTSGGVIFEATVAASSDARARFLSLSLIGVSTDACRRSPGGSWEHGRGLPARGLKRLKPLTEPERAERKREWGTSE